MKIKKRTFGYLSNGKKVELYTLSAGDLKLSLTNYGAALTSLIVPSRNGKRDDVLLGFSGLDGYLNNIPFFGVTVGRFANRIKGAAFTINEEKYCLTANDGKNNLHSGPRGFDKYLWKAESFKKNEGIYIRFCLKSPDGDCGFPGNLKAVVCYGLTKSNELIADYYAETDKSTPVNLTNHAYFNLAGEGNGDILSHEVMLHSSSYVEVDKHAIPTGRVLPVAGTVFDFTKRKSIRAGFDKMGFKGYDHCFVTDGEYGKLRPCADVLDPSSGRSMKVFTTQPGVQFYTGNFINITGKQGAKYTNHSGFCLETQHFPDTPNQSGFPSCIVTPGSSYNERSVFAFDC